MNDWYNDPPEEPAPPQCPVEGCEGVAAPEKTTEDSTTGERVHVCEDCKHTWREKIPWWGYDPSKDDTTELPDDYFHDVPTECPHGKPWTDCGACDHASDIAYDTARENRIFGR